MKLYLCKLKHIDENIQENIYQRLHEDRRQRADVFTQKDKREQFLYAEAACMYLIENELGIKNALLKGKVGTKPYLPENESVSISRSYSENYVLIGLDTNNIIGVDIEKEMEYNSSVEKFSYTDEEKLFIQNHDSKNKAFSMIWTLKESFIKCIGEGLTFPLTEINLSPCNCDDTEELKPSLNPSIKAKEHYFNSYIYKGFNIAVCSKKNIEFPDIQLIDIDFNN